MDKETVNLDGLIEDLGCGRFQVILSVILFLSSLPTFWTYYFMTFGLYNPGWKCLDNATISVNITDVNFANDTSGYITDSCHGFDTCQNVVFNPEASTIATEFGLVCGRSWIASLCISLLMIGNAVAYFFVGMAGDKFGRKLTIQASVFFATILNFISMFSTSWQMFAAIDFLIGATASFTTLFIVVSNESVPQLWRIRVCCLPNWTTSIALYSLLAMIVQDWKTLRLITSICCGVAFLGMFWVPKTLRFMSANGKKKQFLKLVKRISKYNKIDIPQESSIDSILRENAKKNRKPPPPIIPIFRKGHKIKALIIGLSFMGMDMTYFAMSYGISAFPGDVYVNMLILSFTELPSNLFAGVMGNVAGRRLSISGFTITCSTCLFCVAAFDLLTSGGIRTISTLAALVVAKLFLNAAWYVLATAMLEMYPTIVRSTLNSYGQMMSTTGAVLAPFLVPSNPSTFYISYLVMGGLCFVVGCLALRLPETRGKALLNDWEEEEELDTKRVELEHDKNTAV